VKRLVLFCCYLQHFVHFGLFLGSPSNLFADPFSGGRFLSSAAQKVEKIGEKIGTIRALWCLLGLLWAPLELSWALLGLPLRLLGPLLSSYGALFGPSEVSLRPSRGSFGYLGSLFELRRQKGGEDSRKDWCY